MPEQMLACAYLSHMLLEPPQIPQRAIEAAAAGGTPSELILGATAAVGAAPADNFDKWDPWSNPMSC
eukprot:465759-Prymnesium_polylepis.1